MTHWFLSCFADNLTDIPDVLHDTDDIAHRIGLYLVERAQLYEVVLDLRDVVCIGALIESGNDRLDQITPGRCKLSGAGYDLKQRQLTSEISDWVSRVISYSLLTLLNCFLAMPTLALLMKYTLPSCSTL